MWSSRVFLVLVTLSLKLSAQTLISESQLDDRFQKEVLPLYATGQSGVFQGKGNLPIRYLKFERADERGAVVIVSGKGESMPKYQELIFDFYTAGYSVYLMDPRGHGYSGRINLEATIIDVDHFSDYVVDLKTFMDKIVRSKSHRRINMLAHSMGGLIATKFLSAYPGEVDALVLSSPAFQLHLGMPVWVAKGIYSTGIGLGNGKCFALTQGPAIPDTGSLEEDRLTHSEVRHHRRLLQDHDYPSMRMGGVSFNWVKEMTLAGESVPKLASTFQTPTLLLQAGHDLLVKTKRQDTFCDLAPHCRLVRFPKSNHEILQERDEFRAPAMIEIMQFFENAR